MAAPFRRIARGISLAYFGNPWPRGAASLAGIASGFVALAYRGLDKIGVSQLADGSSRRQSSGTPSNLPKESPVLTHGTEDREDEMHPADRVATLNRLLAKKKRYSSRPSEEKIKEIQKRREASMKDALAEPLATSEPNGKPISPKEFAKALGAEIVGRTPKRRP
jgi:hypothetical protein